MTYNLDIMLPEIFLSLSIFSILMLGVFIKKSFNIIFNLTSLIIIITTAIILNNSNNEEKIFLESFIRDPFSNYFKILILLSSLFVLNSSKNFIVENKLDKLDNLFREETLVLDPKPPESSAEEVIATPKETVPKKTRKCPNDPAKLYDIGFTKVSENDGKTYKVVEVSGLKRTMKRWVINK